MRKIEKEMNQAIQNRRDWAKDNTAVVFSDHNGNPYLQATVYLYGHSIAMVMADGTIAADSDTLMRYPTNTTKSRLRALGVDVCTKQGVTYLNGEAV